MRNYNVDLVSEYRCGIAEAPHWDESAQRLYHVDIMGSIYSLDVNTKSYSKYRMDDHTIGTIVPTSQPQLFVVAHNTDVSLITLEESQNGRNYHEGMSKEVPVKPMENLTSVEPGMKTRFNDGKCDSRGRLWVGTMGLELENGVFAQENCGLYCVENENITKKVDNVQLSNGIAWSLDDTRIYYVDSLTRRLDVFDYDSQSATLSNRRVVLDFSQIDCNPDEFPDGMTIDLNGNLWLACYNGGRVLCINPEIGRIVTTVNMPCSKITSVCFGDRDYSTLFVTSASFGLDEQQLYAQPSAGAVFRVNFERENVRGFRPNKFQI